MEEPGENGDRRNRVPWSLAFLSDISNILPPILEYKALEPYLLEQPFLGVKYPQSQAREFTVPL